MLRIDRHAKPWLCLLASVISLPIFAQTPPTVDIPAPATAGGARPQLDVFKRQVRKKDDAKVLNDRTPKQTTEPAKKKKYLIPVKGIAIQGIVEYPEQGITKKAIYKLTSELMKKKLKQHAAQVLTLDEIWQIADALSLFYRHAGFILTRVYVPAQTLKDHVVALQVHEGILGNVRVEQNTLYSKEMLAGPFELDVGHAVLAHEIERELLRINSYPGLRLHAIFRPGKKPGETELVITPKEEKRINGTFAIDNNGNPLVGKYHGIANIQLNNPLGHADYLSATIVENYDPKNGTYGSIHYDFPLKYGYEHLGFEVNRNRFNIGGEFASLQLKSVVKTGKLYWYHSFYEDRWHGLYADFTFDRISSQTEMKAHNHVQDKDSLSVLGLGIRYFTKTPDRQGELNTKLMLHQGFNNFLGAMGPEVQNSSIPSSRTSGKGKRAEGQFTRINFDFDYLHSIFPHQSIFFRLASQYSDSILVPLEQFSLGGPNSVRAYAPAEYLVDNGLFSSLEWTIAAPGFAEEHAYGPYTWGQLLQVSAFVDMAVGDLNDPTENQSLKKQDIVSLFGYGLGLKIHPNDKITMSVQAAKPFDFSRDPSDRKGMRYWLSFFYHF